MLILDATTRSLRVRCAAGHTTTPLRCVTSWRDTTTTAFTPGSTLSSSNGTTGVEIAPPPAASTQRIIDFISVLNTDTVSHTVILYIFNGSINFDMISVTITPGERVEYGEGNGFNTYNSAGSLKTLSVATQNVLSSGFSATVLGADVTNANATANTIADITGLSFPVVANTQYFFQFFIRYTATATTTGARFAISGPAAPTLLAYRSDYGLTATTRTVNEVNAYDSPAAANISSNNATVPGGGNIASIEGFITPSDDGTVIARFASEITSSAIIARAGSLVRFIALV